MCFFVLDVLGTFTKNNRQNLMDFINYSAFYGLNKTIHNIGEKNYFIFYTFANYDIPGK